MTTSSTDEQFTTYQRSNDYRSVLAELLDHADQQVKHAQAELNIAEQERRVNAAIAVRAGYGKTAVANALGISRVTLDKWVADVTADTDQLESVTRHEHIVRRTLSSGS